MKKICILLSSILLSISLSAQITFAEKQAEEPAWEYMQEVLLMPYDSSYLTIQMFPILEAYKKYVGQQLFFTEGAKEKGELRDKNGVFYDSKRYQETVFHKYFEIVDVIGIKKSVFQGLKAGGATIEYGGTFWFFQENNQDKRLSYNVKGEDFPCFVIKETQSKDTLYLKIHLESAENPYDNLNQDYGIILVSGFLKLKETATGSNVVACKHSGGLDPQILSEWKCTDVSITNDENYLYANWNEENNHTYKRKSEVISLVLQNSKNKDTIGYVEFHNILKDFEKLRGGSCFMLEKTYKEYVSEFNRKKQNYNQQAAQGKAKRKQQLTTKYGAVAAEKIITGKYEIGMSKAVCKEIAGYATTVNKTATTEVWKISNIMGYGATYLYFSSDKLTRIVKY